MSKNTGKVFRRRQRILTSLKECPKTMKQLGKQLEISNTLIKKDINELIVERKVEINSGDRHVSIINN